MLYQARVFHSLGGINPRAEVANVFDFRSQLVLGSVQLGLLSEALATELAHCLIDKARILRVTISEQYLRGTNRPRGQFQTRAVDIVGTRPTAVGVGPATQNVVAMFTKNATFGYAGRQAIRGAFAENEIAVGADLDPVIAQGTDITAFTGFAGAIMDVFDSHASTLVLPAPKTENFIDGVRDVESVAFQGAAQRQRHNGRISLETLKKKVAEREVAHAGEVYRSNQTAYGDNVLNWPAAVKAALIAILEGVIERYGAELVASLAAKAGLAFLLALL